MTVEEAIRTAIEYERNVRDFYADAMNTVQDPAGRKVLDVLAREEQYHVDYLEEVLSRWKESGEISGDRLNTAVPDRRKIQDSLLKMREQMSRRDPSVVRQDRALKIMEKALDTEMETSRFYHRMVDSFQEQAPREMFARFLEIEDGHVAIVRAEIDALSGMGFWFDTPEFNLEVIG